MANFFADRLGVKSVYVLDDSGAFGVGEAIVPKAGRSQGIKVLGRDRLDPKAADYTAILTKIKSLNPDALYYGGVTQAGVKLAKQAYDIVPNVIKGGPDGMTSSDLLSGAGFPAVEGWYTSIAAPHLVEDTKAAQFIAAFKGRFNGSPDDYTITAHDASLVIIDAVKRVAASGKPVTNARAWSARQRQPRQHRGPEVAECARSTVAEALKALEWARTDMAEPDHPHPGARARPIRAMGEPLAGDPHLQCLRVH